MFKIGKISKDLKYILLVDDDNFFLKITTKYLDEAGYAYIIAKDGHKAWHYLEKYSNKFFVVLADRVMPKLRGLELLVKMKKASLCIPLILFTAEASKEERCEAISQGVYDFFYKPISKELLLAILKKIKKII